MVFSELCQNLYRKFGGLLFNIVISCKLISPFSSMLRGICFCSLISHNLSHPAEVPGLGMEQPLSRAITHRPCCTTQPFPPHFTATSNVVTKNYTLNFSVLLSTLHRLLQHRLPPLCCPIYLCWSPHWRQNVESLKRGAIADNDPRAAPRLPQEFLVQLGVGISTIRAWDLWVSVRGLS